jgi:pyrimidine deaminase RibD-like protein
VGEGATQPAGQAHAEIVALRAAEQEAHDAELYVTLEPCSYFGRTPPCADALIKAGIAAAHVAVLDPNPLVNGRGVQRMEEHGIPVMLGECACEASELIEAHAKHIRFRLPFVTLLLEPPSAVAAAELAMADAVITDLQPPHPSLHPVVMTVSDEDEPDYNTILQDLGRSGITSCTITGTPDLLRQMLRRGLVDKIVAGAERSAPAGFVRRRTGALPAPHATFYPKEATA